MAVEKFTNKELKFLDEYYKQPTGKDAVIAAGYSPKHAKQRATELLGRTKIKAELERRRLQLTERAVVTMEKQVEDLEKVKEMGFENNDGSIIVAAIREQNRMLGFYADQKVDVTLKDGRIYKDDEGDNEFAKFLKAEVINVDDSGV